MRTILIENQVRLYHLASLRRWLLKAFYFPEHTEYVRGKIKNGLSLFYQISDKILLCSATETIIRDVLLKKLFLKISQGLQVCNFIKKDSNTGVSYEQYEIFKNT